MSTPAGALPRVGENESTTVSLAGATGTVTATVVLIWPLKTLTVKLSVSGPVVRSAANRAA